jgi:hypothetical protein
VSAAFRRFQPTSNLTFAQIDDGLRIQTIARALAERDASLRG